MCQDSEVFKKRPSFKSLVVHVKFLGTNHFKMFYILLLVYYFIPMQYFFYSISFVICNPLSGYLTYGQGDLALFSIRAAPEGSSVPGDGATQASMLWDELVLVLEELGSSFEDVIVGRENLLESEMMQVKGYERVIKELP